MKLLFVGTHRGPGGTESHFVSLSTAMAAAGHEVSALVCPGDYIDGHLASDGRVRRFAAHFERPFDGGAMRALAAAVRATRPDWIVGSFAREYWPTALIGRAHGVPVVLFRHVEERFRQQTARLLPHLVHRIVAPSEFLRERLVDRGIARSRTAVVHNPLDTEAYRPDPARRAEMRARLGFAPDDVVVGFAGRLERQKGVHTLAPALDAAMACCPNLRALWIGSGKAESDVAGLLADSPYRERHVRMPWSAEMPACYAAMDVLAFPSISSETFGRVSIEAQACGVPVLASRTGGVPETLRDGVTGRLVAAGDVAAWTDALIDAARDVDGRARMGAAGRAFVRESFDGPRITRDFERLLGAASRVTGHARERRVPAAVER